MPHRAETIMVAVEAVLTGLVTTGARVKRARAYELSDADLPGLTINMGQDELAEDGNMAFIDRQLNVEIIAYVKDNSTVDTTLNKIRREVHIALYADHTLGESFVSSVVSNGDDAPEISGNLEKTVASQKLNYIVAYRHSVTDPGA